MYRVPCTKLYFLLHSRLYALQTALNIRVCRVCVSCAWPSDQSATAAIRLRVEVKSDTDAQLSKGLHLLEEGKLAPGAQPVQRAAATRPLRAEVKFDTCAQLSEAGS